MYSSFSHSNETSECLRPPHCVLKVLSHQGNLNSGLKSKDVSDIYSMWSWFAFDSIGKEIARVKEEFLKNHCNKNWIQEGAKSVKYYLEPNLNNLK